MIACEQCQRPASVIEATHSTLIILQKVDATSGYSFGQCEEGTPLNGIGWQHFHCSEVCMLAGVQACLNEHYSEEILHGTPPGGGTTRLPQVVLSAGLTCKICQQPLTTTAYRFGLTLATPYNRMLDESLNEFAEWCCSIAHAQQSALAAIASIQQQ